MVSGFGFTTVPNSTVLRRKEHMLDLEAMRSARLGLVKKYLQIHETNQQLNQPTLKIDWFKGKLQLEKRLEVNISDRKPIVSG